MAIIDTVACQIEKYNVNSVNRSLGENYGYRCVLMLECANLRVNRNMETVERAF